jgi:hypothetical protein
MVEVSGPRAPDPLHLDVVFFGVAVRRIGSDQVGDFEEGEIEL